MAKQEINLSPFTPNIPAIKRRQGFAVMDPEQRRQVARLGGQTSHGLGKAHRFTPEEAREAGRKGGRTLSRNRAYMVEIGRRGGMQSQRRQAEERDLPNRPK